MNINYSSFRETAFTFSSFLGQKEYKLSLAVPLPRFLTGAISRGPPSSHKYDLSPLLLLSLLLASNHTRLRVPFRSGAFGNEGGGGTGGQQTEGARLGQIYRSPTKEPFSGPQIFPSCGGRKRALFWADPSIKYGAVFGGESFRTCRTLRCCIFAFHIRFTSCILKG